MLLAKYSWSTYCSGAKEEEDLLRQAVRQGGGCLLPPGKCHRHLHQRVVADWFYEAAVIIMQEDELPIFNWIWVRSLADENGEPGNTPMVWNRL